MSERGGGCRAGAPGLGLQLASARRSTDYGPRRTAWTSIPGAAPAPAT